MILCYFVIVSLGYNNINVHNFKNLDNVIEHLPQRLFELMWKFLQQPSYIFRLYPFRSQEVCMSRTSNKWKTGVILLTQSAIKKLVDCYGNAICLIDKNVDYIIEIN